METLRTYAQRWLTGGPDGIHPRTAENYERSLRLQILPALGDRPVAALTWHEVRALLKQLLADGKGASVVRNAQIALASCLTMALEEGTIDQNPARGTLRRLIRSRPHPGLERSLSRIEVGRFLAACRLIAPDMVDLFWTLAYAGCAIGEALGLQPEDVDVADNRLRIARQWIEGAVDLPKRGRVRVIDVPVPLTMRLAERIDALPGFRWLFQGQDGEPWHASSVRNRMRTVLAAAGLPARYSPHWFRHAYACRLLEETGDLLYVQRQLGHRSITMTADTYGAGARPHRRDALERLVADEARPHGGARRATN